MDDKVTIDFSSRLSTEILPNDPRFFHAFPDIVMNLLRSWSPKIHSRQSHKLCMLLHYSDEGIPKEILENFLNDMQKCFLRDFDCLSGKILLPRILNAG